MSEGFTALTGTVGSGVFALIGAVGGALLTGAASLYGSWKQRRNRARASAMILCDGLVQLTFALEKALDDDCWWANRLAFSEWTEHRDNVALGGFKGIDFQTFNGCFMEARRLEHKRVAKQPFDKLDATRLYDMTEWAFRRAIWLGLKRRERLYYGLIYVGARLGIGSAEGELQRHPFAPFPSIAGRASSGLAGRGEGATGD